MKFHPSNFTLDLYGYFTRFKANIFRGGDQSLFLSRELFEEVGGFDESLLLMEDYDMVRRLSRRGEFAVLKGPVITSSRKYQRNGTIRLQWLFLIIQFMYRSGFSQKRMLTFYERWVH